MGRMKELLMGIESECGACKEAKCEGCKMRIDLGDKIVYVAGKTRRILGVELKSELAKTGAFILSCMKVVVVLFMLCGSAYAQTGECSYYNTASCQREGTSGVWTASGERFTDDGLTCAMRSREFGVYYKVTNLANGKSVIVKHNDFGPNKHLATKHNRVIDLSEGAFRKIANTRVGLIQVKVERIDK